MAEFIVYSHAAAPDGGKLELIIDDIDLTGGNGARTEAADGRYQVRRSYQGNSCSGGRFPVDVVEIGSGQGVSISQPGERYTTGEDAGSASQHDGLIAFDVPIETMGNKVTGPVIVARVIEAGATAGLAQEA